MMVQLVYHDGTVTVPSWFLVCSVGAGLIRILGMIGNADVVMEVRDLLGRVVYSAITRSVKGYIDEQIKLPEQLTDGMYLLTIRVGDEQRSIKVVVTR